MKLHEVLSRNIRFMRFERGISQKDLAKRAGLSQSTVAQLESGLKSPSLSTMEKIAKELQLETYQLLVPDLVQVNTHHRQRTRQGKA